MLVLSNQITKNVRNYQKGFTLLEMLTVLFVIGLAASLAVPNFSLLFDRLKFSNERDEIFRIINTLPYKALSQNQDFVLIEESIKGGNINQNQKKITEIDNIIESPFRSVNLTPLELNFPDGWKLKIPQPIFYRASGFCGGGSITLEVGSLEYSFILESPYCQIKS